MHPALFPCITDTTIPGGQKRVRRFIIRALATGVAVGVMLATQSGWRAMAATDEPSLLQIDNDFVQAVSNTTWRRSEGCSTQISLGRRRRKDASQGDVLKSLPTPALGSETGAQLKPRTYGQVGAVMSGRDRVHVLRIWVKRPAGWRLIVYHEVALGQQAATAPGFSVMTARILARRCHSNRKPRRNRP